MLNSLAQIIHLIQKALALSPNVYFNYSILVLALTCTYR